jgi:hypothetical protein
MDIYVYITLIFLPSRCPYAYLFFASRTPEVKDGDMAFHIEETYVGSGDNPFWK